MIIFLIIQLFMENGRHNNITELAIFFVLTFLWMFQTIDFAVLSKGAEQYNFNHFYRNFGGNNFYIKKIEQQSKRQTLYSLFAFTSSTAVESFSTPRALLILG